MLQEYLERSKTDILPRLPLEGHIDLTYRCNNSCRHCWISISSDSRKREEELSFDRIKHVVDQAREMGCRRWSISGGEPMLRGDFKEIFDYATRNSVSYNLNTNGTLITPEIAGLMKKKGSKLVALYGATAEVHDHITRNPGSFEATMRGFAYLKEAGAGFCVQVVPMKDNYHQFDDMLGLAASLSKHYRIGAAWLYLSAYGCRERNSEIMRQRLSPEEVVELDKPNLSYEELMRNGAGCGSSQTRDGGSLFGPCISSRNDFHIDPYGKMAFCYFIKDPVLRFDLKKGDFKECWDGFIPSLANNVRPTKEYSENCGACELRNDCRCCPVYAYLEHGRLGAKVEYLCAVAKENRKYKDNWKKNHRRYFKIADITIQMESDLPFTKDSFRSKFKHFEVDGPGDDTITIRHHFSLPDIDGRGSWKEFYRKTPWAIYRDKDSWIYLGITEANGVERIHRVTVFNDDHTRGRIYNDETRKKTFLKGDLTSVTLFASDQILLARVLADRQGCYFHSSGVDFEGKGLLFAGHSEAGKSTMVTMLKDKADILCDDRMIVRKRQDSYRIYGTWSHGDVPDVSGSSAPLKAILFLEKSDKNELIPMSDKNEITRRLLSVLIKPFVTADWWEKTLALTEDISRNIPCYALKFDRTGGVVELLKRL